MFHVKNSVLFSSFTQHVLSIHSKLYLFILSGMLCLLNSALHFSALHPRCKYLGKKDHYVPYYESSFFNLLAIKTLLFATLHPVYNDFEIKTAVD